MTRMNHGEFPVKITIEISGKCPTVATAENGGRISGGNSLNSASKNNRSSS